MTETPNRLERRKARTRGALIEAAQGFIARGELNAPIAEITQAADVGMGSFYNHFVSREQLFQSAVDGALELLGGYLDSLTDVDADPAEAFTRSFRISGRLFRLQPELSRVLIHSGPELITSPHGLGPRAARDIVAGVDAGYFRVADPQLSLALVAGALLGVGQLLLEQPDRDDVEAVDGMAYSVLLALGMPDADARDLCARPLPPMSDVPSVDGESA
ncbi:TetR family transcriptional regulator [Rhodococcus sp. 06-462-5]|uniref:TetR/AcrR family transcriptional regulator n=1 Tax=unclassified Rhodococcus (in: high G+C Gram-positive bacteria) TaxID=192944 RepID=UPI000B9AA6D4|nr:MULTISPECIES: TetR/AcrR family transcriptional regulator [unclassified Rhodococcus (in: high G+C Gram-positive bacteria)]OZC68362.1 TetR family transcriptional regulator [Rhodococcus sp. 06-462-5]OZE66158.1 TetR family transcriptional regulator [Rhodococcus sp. 02-925g]